MSDAIVQKFRARVAVIVPRWHLSVNNLRLCCINKPLLRSSGKNNKILLLKSVSIKNIIIPICFLLGVGKTLLVEAREQGLLVLMQPH